MSFGLNGRQNTPLQRLGGGRRARTALVIEHCLAFKEASPAHFGTAP